MPRAAPYYVYLLRCSDTTLYAGIARDVKARVAQHENGTGAKYTRGRGPFVVLAKVKCANRSAASKLEAAVKARPKGQKLAFLRAHATAKRQVGRAVPDKRAANR